MWRIALERSSANAVAYCQQWAVLYAAALSGEAEQLVLGGNASLATRATFANGPWRTR